MEDTVYERHERLKKFPPAQLIYIVYRRLLEHGAKTTWLWLSDKVSRRTHGFSVPALSCVAPRLYVGGQQTRSGLAAMRSLGITSVVNMRDESDDEARGVLLDAYLWLPTPDDAAPTLKDLARGVVFIEQQLAENRGVYIHCASGVGRAPTMAAAYLVHQGATPEKAWEAIRKGRPFIRPTPPQLAAIREFAKGTASSSGNATERQDPSGTFRHASDSGSNNGPSSSLDEREALAYGRISEDASLTGDLTDDLAQALLARAREEVHKLVGATAGLEEGPAWAFLDPKLHQLRQHLRMSASASATAADPEETLAAHLTSITYPDPSQ